MNPVLSRQAMSPASRARSQVVRKPKATLRSPWAITISARFAGWAISLSQEPFGCGSAASCDFLIVCAGLGGSDLQNGCCDG